MGSSRSVDKARAMPTAWLLSLAIAIAHLHERLSGRAIQHERRCAIAPGWPWPAALARLPSGHNDLQLSGPVPGFSAGGTACAFLPP